MATLVVLLNAVLSATSGLVDALGDLLSGGSIQALLTAIVNLMSALGSAVA